MHPDTLRSTTTWQQPITRGDPLHRGSQDLLHGAPVAWARRCALTAGASPSASRVFLRTTRAGGVRAMLEEASVTRGQTEARPPKPFHDRDHVEVLGSSRSWGIELNTQPPEAHVVTSLEGESRLFTCCAVPLRTGAEGQRLGLGDWAATRRSRHLSTSMTGSRSPGDGINSADLEEYDHAGRLSASAPASKGSPGTTRARRAWRREWQRHDHPAHPRRRQSHPPPPAAGLQPGAYWFTVPRDGFPPLRSSEMTLHRSWAGLGVHPA